MATTTMIASQMTTAAEFVKLLNLYSGSHKIMNNKSAEADKHTLINKLQSMYSGKPTTSLMNAVRRRIRRKYVGANTKQITANSHSENRTAIRPLGNDSTPARLSQA